MELTKADKRLAKDIIRRGILHRHAQWQQELRKLLDSPFDENKNEYDRSLQITNEARKFYKEAMEMEDYYRSSMLMIGLANLYHHHLITDDDLAELSEEIKQSIHLLLNQ